MPIFILGSKNDPGQLWIANTDDGTIKPFNEVESGTGTGSLGADTIQSLRRNGYSVIRDVDIAVSVQSLDQPVSRQFTE